MADADQFVESVMQPVRIVAGPPQTNPQQPAGYRLPADSGQGLILDFGQELFGRLQVTFGDQQSPQPQTLMISLGESVTELVVGAFTRMTVDVQPGGTAQTQPTGFRFVQLQASARAQDIDLAQVVAVSVTRQLQPAGTFRCSDERLNQIWDVGVHTVHLCMQQELWDGIKRGQTVWVGDLFPAAQVVSTVFGQHPVVPRSLDRIRDETLQHHPSDLGWMNGISSYSLWWLVTQRQWFLYHGDRQYLEQQRSYLLRLLPQLFRHIDADGVEHLDGWRFLDWSTQFNAAAVHAGFQALFILALQDAAVLCQELDLSELQQQCVDYEQELRRHVPPPGHNKQANALMALAGLADPAAVNRYVLSDHPLEGLTPFLGYSVLEARALAGDEVGCLQLIRDYWGAMLDLGATSFWEDFDIRWISCASRIDELVTDRRQQFAPNLSRCCSGVAMSLCHAWSCGVVAWLSQHVLGIRPASPGCRSVHLQPQLGDLQWAEGSLPTPLGWIRVRHELDSSGQLQTTSEIPAGVDCVPCEVLA